MLRDFPTCNSFAKPKHVLPFRWRETRNNTILYILIVAKIEGGFNISPLIATFVTDGMLAGKGPGRGGAERAVCHGLATAKSKPLELSSMVLPLQCTGSTAPHTVLQSFSFTTTATKIRDGSHQH